jgi:hypothetical protein
MRISTHHIIGLTSRPTHTIIGEEEIITGITTITITPAANATARHQPRNPNYHLSWDELRSVAARSLDAIDNGWYLPYGTDVPVDFGPKMEYTDAQTAYYVSGDEEMAAWGTKDLGQEKKETKILIKEYSTLVGARKLHGMLAFRSQVAGGDKAEAEAKVVQGKGKEGVGDHTSKGKEGVEESIVSSEGAKETEQLEDQPSSTETVKEAEEKATKAGEEVKDTKKPNKPQPTPPNHTIGMLNFASAQKPGGGVHQRRPSTRRIYRTCIHSLPLLHHSLRQGILHALPGRSR